jgi:CRP/FNR family transcriptional regulator, cyclic AMP receptor protein
MKSQVQPEAVATYDPQVALQFFRAAGKPADIAEGSRIFEQNERSIPLLRKNKMYLLLKGEVGLVAGRKNIGRVRPGEIFGEMAVISDAARSASAVARTACRVIELDDNAFQAALRKKPDFAVMMMSVMIHRLRNTISDLRKSNALSAEAAVKESAAFDPKVLAQLVEGLSDDAPVFYQQGASIVAEGQKGMRMYAVVDGRVRVSIGGLPVERLGPGGVFGEAALIDVTATRIADVVAEADTTLQPIGRAAFLTLVKLSPEFGQTMLGSLAARLRYLTARL